MSTWISKAALACGLALAACVAAPGPSALPPGRALVMDGVSIVPPRGYCIDPGSRRSTETAAVVLMGRCAAGESRSPAVITVTVGRPGTAGIMAAGGAEVARFAASPDGRATLSETGRAADLQLISARGQGQAVILNLADRQLGTYWRALTGLKGHLVSISATGARGTPLAPEEGRAILDAALTALERANRG